MDTRFKRGIICLLATAMLALAATGWAQDGKAIAVIGEASLQRGDQSIKLKKGTPVQVGDLVKTGERAAAQLKMSDNTILALRQNSEMEISGYTLSTDQPQESEARFSLIRGGVRTLTGEIATRARENFEVKTAAATIGIRGTHFRLRLCEGDCADEGAEAPRDGLYGGVIEGRIATVNEAGEMVFGVDEYFFVADQTTIPERLPAPPALLSDRLASLAAARRGTTTETAESRTQEPAALEVLPQEMAGLSTIASTLTVMSVDQLRAVEDSISPENLAHVEPIVVPPSDGSSSDDGFADIGGSGDIRGQIIWMTTADIDLHLQAPTGDHVYYGNPQVSLSGGATAELDHDNLGDTIDISPDQRVENLTVTGSQIPTGEYKYSAHSYSGNNNGLPTNVQIRVTGDGNNTSLTDTVTLSNGQTSGNYIVNFQGTGTTPEYYTQP